MAGFSTSEDVVLNRSIDVEDEESLQLVQVWGKGHKKLCCDWITRNGYKRVCLQFPDRYLPFSVLITDSLKEALPGEGECFILADTSYGSCCIDEITAAHVEADSLIHFGNACCSKASGLPVLYVFPEFEFSLEQFRVTLQAIAETLQEKPIYIYFDVGYHHVLTNSEKMGCERLNEKLHDIIPNQKIHMVTYPISRNSEHLNEPMPDRVCIFVGGNNRRFANLSLTSKASRWLIYDPKSNNLKEQNPLTTSYIRRRYFYIEKCKDARMLGLIVATLTSTGYLDVVDRIQEMARKRNIKTQIISVGRINPAKLANFMEIDCFVLIGCPFNNMFASKDYYRPIVSVFEAEIALNPAWHMKYPDVYVTDFKDLLPEGRHFMEFEAKDIQESDVSLISGSMRHATGSGGLPGVDTITSDMVQRPKMELTPAYASLAFEDRTWKGLEPKLGCTEPAKLQKGLSGIPIGYSHD